MEFEKTRNKLCIVGCSDSCKLIPQDKPDEYEFWGVNNLFWSMPHAPWSRWFEIHQIAQDESGVWLRRGKSIFRTLPVLNYLMQLSTLDIPVYMREVNPLVPKSIAFPYDQLVERFGSYFTNTVSWEIALAITMGFEEIRIYGVDMAIDSEYRLQRASCEYFLGIAAGLGIKIWIPDTCDLLKTRFLYGKDEPVELPFRMKMQEVMEHLNKQIKEADKVIELNTQKKHQCEGAIFGVRNVDMIWKNITGG